VINGNARTATGFSGKSPGNVTGSAVVGPVATFTAWPDLPLDTFRKWADQNGMYFTTAQHWTHSRTITGGVLYVKGTFKYSGSDNLVGCIIAEQGIDWSGSGSQIKTNQFPALVTTEPGAGIDLSGNGTFHGLIYAMQGPFEKTGNGLVTGTILARGTWDKGGGWDAMAYEYSYPTPPGLPPGTSEDQVFVSAWQK
jgi:hypothetical protein